MFVPMTVHDSTERETLTALSGSEAGLDSELAFLPSSNLKMSSTPWPERTQAAESTSKRAALWPEPPPARFRNQLRRVDSLRN